MQKARLISNLLESGHEYINTFLQAPNPHITLYKSFENIMAS
jgi:hypothetical protein